MLSMDDLLDYCELDRDEIAAVAEHEHLPLAVAAELSENLVDTPEGVAQLHQMVLDNIQHAKETGNKQHVRELARAYLHLQKTHPIRAAA
ncbi:MAG TPA: hypothetical protein PLW86_04765 [Rhodocyclaceae bacterium]|nr:hypothetical protein [Rhodocyclaceae bacterium]